ncbi:hypothetical protein K1I73_06565 [Streptococcus gordonii]|uniref:hypothetical protein n=1 Tax=Streptococcus gordonii TaxID=1302 RepID=UPI001CBB831E|nr:hypothetical protein [Streptococcus gordonii]MBZ2140001.1 hypothetical protein [Streptococcus gordonii]
MGGRGARLSKGKTNLRQGKSDSDKKLTPIQIKLKKKLMKSRREKREHRKSIGLKKTINYDTKDNRIARTQGESHIARASSFRLKQRQKTGVSAISQTHGKMKKRWEKHFNEHHSAKR